MASTSGLLGLIPVRSTVGASLVGVYLSSVFYGVTLLQTYQYFHKYWGRDKMHITVLVTILTIMDTLTTVSNMYSMWYYLIEHYGNPIVILSLHWTFTMSLAVTAVIEFLVKGFYAYRLWLLSEKKMYFLPGVVVLLGLAHLVVGVFFVALITQHGTVLYIPKITYLLLTAFSFSLAGDVLIASSITFVLLRIRNRGLGLKQTDKLLWKVVTYTVSTGLLTIICTTVTLALAQRYQHSFYDVMFYFPLSKCYINSMLAFLNARDSLWRNRDLVNVNLNMADSSQRDHATQIKFSPEERSKASENTANTFPMFNLKPEDATVLSITTHAV